MKPMFTKRLSTKLIVIISSALLLLLFLQLFITASQLKSNLIETQAHTMYNMSEVIKNSTRYSMLLNLKNDVNKILENIGTNEGIESIHIYNKQGDIIFSTDTTKRFTSVSIESEICAPCHNPVHQTPLDSLALEDRIRFLDGTESGHKDLLILNPVKNETSCYTAACHAHPKSAKLLGILELRISLERIDEVIGENVSGVIYHSIVETILIALLIGFLITLLINKPLKQIKNGIKEYSQGNLKHVIEVRSQDEFGNVAQQLNEMASKLESAENEIKDWNIRLHQKIDEKTKELKSLYGQVMQIEKLASLGKLSATVAHELNNPLAGILNFSKLIIRKLKKQQVENEFEKLIEYLNLIAEESERCGRIVKDLLLFSHRGEEVFAEEDLIAIIERALLLINHHLAINKIELIKNFSAGTISLKCDSQKIQQALLSLLINAIEAMQPGGTLTVQAEKVNRKAIIRVTDTGSGIHEKDLAHIFEPFFTTKETGKGTGLGLAVVYGIISQHKGTVEVESTSEEGTTFKITIDSDVSLSQEEKEI